MSVFKLFVFVKMNFSQRYTATKCNVHIIWEISSTIKTNKHQLKNLMLLGVISEEIEILNICI